MDKDSSLLESAIAYSQQHSNLYSFYLEKGVQKVSPFNADPKVKRMWQVMTKVTDNPGLWHVYVFLSISSSFILQMHSLLPLESIILGDMCTQPIIDIDLLKLLLLKKRHSRRVRSQKKSDSAFIYYQQLFLMLDYHYSII